MRRSSALLPVLLAMISSHLEAQAVVSSPAPRAVQVTVYRAPLRSPDQVLDLRWLDGYALISETRTVSIPAGESEIRFEGVASGIQPQSAIVTGFPDGIVERNRDAYLLSAGSLLDRSLGRHVHLRRTSRATGKTIEEEAIIRSGAQGAVVLQTADGFEALRCTGQPETLVYREVPAGLSAKPTLSVRTRAARPMTATITLSYLAGGFDWQANYIGRLSEDGSRVDLFAWLTLASTDETSFPEARTLAVAGRLNHSDGEEDEPSSPGLSMHCWPQGRTHEIPGRLEGASMSRSSPQMVDAITAQSVGAFAEQDVIVTGSRIRASREELGDVKLYRIAEPVTVAANSQKQVAFLEQNQVRVDTVYRQRLQANQSLVAEPATRYLLSRNRREEGLGLPLPAGQMQLFAMAGSRPILFGEGFLADNAVGEKVEIALGSSPAVTTTVVDADFEDDGTTYVLTATNAQPVAIRYEAEFDVGEDEKFRTKERVSRRNGRPLWATTIPANGRAIFSYRIVGSDG